MGLKIWLQESVQDGELGEDSKLICRDGVMRLLNKVKRPDTVVNQHFVEKDPSTPDSLNFPWPLNWACLEMLRQPVIVNCALRAQEEGFDAVVINCALDPGLHEARAMVNIPVTSVTESGLLLAQLLGRRIGVVAPSETIVHTLEEKLNFLGFQERAIKHRPVRHFEMIFGLADAFRGKPERLIDDFEKVAWELIHDGADVIALGCGWLGPALSLNGYAQVRDANVPVVDNTAAALKLAELLSDLQKSIGIKKTNLSNSYYQTPPGEVWDQAGKAYKKLANSLIKQTLRTV
jgi:allantoin racemase